MLREICRVSGLLSVLALLAIGSTTTARGADGLAERYRMARYYECCYGPNGYVKRMNWGRTVPCGAEKCEPDQGPRRGCCCCHCCQTCLVPGARPPDKCLDIYLYHIIFPMSPWYSNPRDGICYPAYGSKSPTCVPQND